MDDAFSQALAEWTAFYALMGGAAATLLGLLFVAVSVRLNIFHQREVADVRDFAAFTFGTFLVAIAVAGFAIAPHAHRFSLALSLLLVSIAAFVAIAWIARLWIRLNAPAAGTRPGYTSGDWRGLAYFLLMSGPYIGLDRRGGAAVAIASRCAGLAGGRRGVAPGHGHGCRLGDALSCRRPSSVRGHERQRQQLSGWSLESGTAPARRRDLTNGWAAGKPGHPRKRPGQYR